MKLLSYRQWVALFVLSLCPQIGPAWAQDPMPVPEGIPPESDYMYSKHLEQVQEIMKNPNLAQREQQLENFMQKVHPKAKILNYFESFFSQTVEAYSKAGKQAEADALLAKMQKLFPDSASALVSSMSQAFSKKDYATAIEIGEKLHAKAPNPQTSIILAQSYMATNNAAKAEVHAAQVVEALGVKETASFAAWLAQYYAGQNNLQKSVEYYNQLLETFPRSAPDGWGASEWKDLRVSAHTMRATLAYIQKDYDAAIRNYTETLKLSPQNAAAYLYLGLSHWKKQELDEAMGAFAKAVVLGQGQAAKAREYLEQIYKPRNNNSLEGLDAILENAKKQLNM